LELKGLRLAGYSALTLDYLQVDLMGNLKGQTQVEGWDEQMAALSVYLWDRELVEKLVECLEAMMAQLWVEVLVEAKAHN
jgi:hypothetical protein